MVRNVMCLGVRKLRLIISIRSFVRSLVVTTIALRVVPTPPLHSEWELSSKYPVSFLKNRGFPSVRLVMQSRISSPTFTKRSSPIITTRLRCQHCYCHWHCILTRELLLRTCLEQTSLAQKVIHQQSSKRFYPPPSLTHG